MQSLFSLSWCSLRERGSSWPIFPPPDLYISSIRTTAANISADPTHPRHKLDIKPSRLALQRQIFHLIAKEQKKCFFLTCLSFVHIKMAEHTHTCKYCSFYPFYFISPKVSKLILFVFVRRILEFEFRVWAQNLGQ